MENKFVSKFGHNIELKELDTIKISIFKVDEDFKQFSFEIEKPLKDLKTESGEDKLLFTHRFFKGTRFLAQKMSKVKIAFERGEILEMPYKIRTFNGKKYLNLIFLNSEYEK